MILSDLQSLASDRFDALFAPSEMSLRAGPFARLEDVTPLGAPPGPAQGMFLLSTDTGRTITPQEARQAPTVLSCRTLIAGSLSRMEWRVLALSGRNREPRTDHALYRLLNHRPNRHQSAQQFREALAYDALDYANAYAYIERRGVKPVALHKLRPDRITVTRHPETGDLIYLYLGSAGEQEPIPAWNMLHVRAHAQDGLLGDSMPILMRNAIAIELDAQRFVASFFRRGARPSGILTYPGKLGDQERKNLRESWSGEAGAANAHGTPLLEGGIKWEKTATDPNEAQLLEARAFARQVICGFYGVPPHMVGDTEKQSYASAEEAAQQFVDFTLAVWAARFEGEVALKLIDERESIETEINFERLLKGDMLSRLRAYSLGVANGIYSRNECRAKEGMSPVDGGDRILVPLNMAVLDADATKDGTPGPLVIGVGSPPGAQNQETTP